jgi:hypothetical protein
MRILLAADTLGTVGGVESYTLTVAENLERLGHQVWLWTRECGDAAEMAEQRGLRVVTDQGPGRPEPDALLVQDAAAALSLAEMYPRVPQAFVAHSDHYDLFLPPQVPGLVAAAVTLYDRVDRRVRALAVPTEVVRLTQPVDVARFRPLRPMRERPRTALALGHYHFGERLEILREACSASGIELLHAGMRGSTLDRPVELALNDVEVVFGKGRVIHEAMACGRAAYVWDVHGADGWVTPERYAKLAADNFAGQSEDLALDSARLADDLAAYDPRMGLANRELAVRHHAATAHAAAVAEMLERIAPRERPVEAPLEELARITRLMHRADAWTTLHHAELSRLAAAEQREQAVAAHMASHADELTRRARAAERRAEAAEAALAELAATRRWRVVQAALRPPDRLRVRWR